MQPADERISRTIESYDRIAASFAVITAGVSAEFAAFRARFRELLADRAVVADLGCGPGRDLAWLRDNALRVVGVDLSAGQLKIAAERGGPVVQSDLRSPPFADESLNGIWSSAALLHVPTAQTGETLRAWRRLLMPGGVLALSTTTSAEGSEGWQAATRYTAAGAGPGDPPRQRWFAHREACELLAQVATAGFVIVVTIPATGTWLQVIARKPA